MTKKKTAPATIKREMPDFEKTFDLSAVGCKGLHPIFAELQMFFWPECYISEHSGKVIMPPDDARQIELLCQIFGVPLKVEENSLSVLERAYTVFRLGLMPDVLSEARMPGTNTLIRSWPDDWRDYMLAVVALDTEKARALAKKLQPLSPDCVFPETSAVERPTPSA